MDNQALWEKLMSLSMDIGMNQRYYQHGLWVAQSQSLAVDVFVVFTTMLGVVVGLVSFFQKDNKELGVFSLVSSCIAAFAGIVLIITPANENVSHYASLFQSWTDLRVDVDNAIADLDTLPRDENGPELRFLQRRYRDLRARENSILARERFTDPAQLKRFREEEERSRGAVKPGDSASDKGGQNDT